MPNKRVKKSSVNESQERLIVKNFFSLKDINIELGRFNVFIGEQASGKSLLLKLIYFFREAIYTPVTGYSLNDMLSLLNNTDEIEKIISKSFRSMFNTENQDNFLLKYQNDKFSINIEHENKTLKIEFSKELKVEFEKLSNKIESHNLSGLPAQPHLWLKLVSTTKLKVFGQNIFIPASRRFLVMLDPILYKLLIDNPGLDHFITNFGWLYNTAKGFYNDVTDIPKLNEIVKWFDNKSTQILKGSYVKDNLNGYLKQKRGDTKLKDLASGQQEFLPLYLFLRFYLIHLFINFSSPEIQLYFSEAHLYIEEPEVQLYSTAQEDLIELLVYVTNVTKSHSLNLSTHSSDILMVLNRLILADEVIPKNPKDVMNKAIKKKYKNITVPFNELRAYYLSNGKAKDIRDYDSKFIYAKDFDQISEDNAIEFDKLLDLRYDK